MTSDKFIEILFPLLEELDCLKEDPEMCTKEDKEDCPLAMDESNECIKTIYENYKRDLKRIDCFQVKVSEIENPRIGEDANDYIHIDNETFIVGQYGNPKELSFSFNQTIYLEEEAGDNMNWLLLELWRKYKDGETSLQGIEADIVNYVKLCFYKKEANYGRYRFEVYKKLTESH